MESLTEKPIKYAALVWTRRSDDPTTVDPIGCNYGESSNYNPQISQKFLWEWALIIIKRNMQEIFAFRLDEAVWE